jgi:hypothetical protein
MGGGQGGKRRAEPRCRVAPSGWAVQGACLGLAVAWDGHRGQFRMPDNVQAASESSFVAFSHLTYAAFIMQLLRGGSFGRCCYFAGHPTAAASHGRRHRRGRAAARASNAGWATGSRPDSRGLVPGRRVPHFEALEPGQDHHRPTGEGAGGGWGVLTGSAPHPPPGWRRR